MSDAVKWAIIAACIVLVVASIIALPAFGVLDDIFTDNEAINTAVSGISAFLGYLASAKALLNNFVYPPALNIMITLSMFMWVVYAVIRTTTFVIRMIYK